MLIHKQGISRILLLPLAVNIALIISYVGLWIITAREGYLWRADFTAFYTGGAIVRDGLGSQLYDLELQKEYQQELLAGRSFSQGVLPFISPPHFALLMAPITYLPLSQAYIIWIFIQLLLLIILTIQLYIFGRSWPLIDRWLMITACLALPGLLRSFLLGALSLIVTLCIFNWYLSVNNEKHQSSGIWLLLGTIKPQLIITPALACYFGKLWKTVIVFTLGCLAIVGSTMILFGWQIWTNYLKLLSFITTSFGEFGINPNVFYNLKGTLTLWLGNGFADWINIISIGGFLISLIITAWLWYRKTDTNNSVLILKVVITLSLSAFFSLHFYQHDGLLLAIPGILFYEYLRIRDHPRRQYSILALIAPAVFFVDEFVFNAYLPIRLPVVATIGLIIWAGIYYLSENHVIMNSIKRT